MKFLVKPVARNIFTSCGCQGLKVCAKLLPI